MGFGWIFFGREKMRFAESDPAAPAPTSERTILLSLSLSSLL